MDPNTSNTNISPSNNATPNPTIIAPSSVAMPSVPAPTPSAQAPSQPAQKPSAKTVFQHWYTWVIIVLGFFCIVSLIFAAYVLSKDAENQSKIDELTNSLAEQKVLTAKYAAQLGQKVEDSSHAGYIDDDKTTTKDFIYVGEWGLRFNIPSELTEISYIYKTEVVEGIDGAVVSETEMLCVIGVPRSATRTPEYYNLGVEGAPLGCLTKQPDNNLGTDSTAKSVYQDGTSYYIYHAPQAPKSIREEDKEWEETAIKLIQDLLSRNITKF